MRLNPNTNTVNWGEPWTLHQNSVPPQHSQSLWSHFICSISIVLMTILRITEFSYIYFLLSVTSTRIQSPQGADFFVLFPNALNDF